MSLFKRMLPWFMLFIATLFCLYVFVQQNMLNAIGEELIGEFGLSSQQLGHVFAFFTYGNILTLFPAGLLLDRLATKRLLLGVFLLSLAAGYLFAVAHTPLTLYLARFMLGVTAAFSFLAAIKVATHWFAPQQMALVVGIIVTIIMLGGYLSQSPMALLTHQLGWRQTSKLVALFGVAFVLLQLVFLRAQPNASEITPQPTQKRAAGELKLVLVNPQNWLIGLYICMLNLPLIILGGAWGGPYLTKVHGFTKLEAAHITGVLFLGMLLGSPLAGWLSDRIGRRKRPMVIGAVFLLIILTAVLFLIRLPFATELMIYFLLGLISGFQVIGYPVITESNPPALAATATSIASVLIVAGGVLVPVYGWLLDQTMQNSAQLVETAFLRANTMMLIGAGLALLITVWVRETYCRVWEHR